MSVFQTMDVKECTACGCLHRTIHVLTSDGARWYYCPRTGDQGHRRVGTAGARVITVLCPSRGRPKEAAALLESFIATKATDAQLAFLVDDDDPTREQYPVTAVGQMTIVGAPTGDPTGPLNREAMRSEDDIVAFTGDDSRFETPGWDVLVRRALSSPGFCWGFDPNAWPSTVFVSREIVQALGWLALPTLHRGYFDAVWATLAEATGTKHVVDASFPHDNSAGDPTSPNFKPERLVPRAVIEADAAACQLWMASGFEDACKKIRAFDLARFF